MSYQLDMLKQQLTSIVSTANQVMYEAETTSNSNYSRLQYMETRLAYLEDFVKRAEPYIKMMELVDTK